VAVGVGDIEVDLVALDGDQGGAFGSLVAGEVRKGHGSNLGCRRVLGAAASKWATEGDAEGTGARRVRVFSDVLKTAFTVNERTAQCPTSLPPICGSTRCAPGAGLLHAGSSKWRKFAISR